MSLRARLAQRVVNPSARADPEGLRAAVDGKVVVVTGASFGIGRALAGDLVAAGARVLLVARSADALDAAAQELGPAARAIRCDLADPDDVATLAERLLAVHGHVDVVVSNAGKSLRRSVAASAGRMQDFTRLDDVNFRGPVRLLLDLLPAMRERGGGLVVNVSTIGVLVPPAPRWAGYVASKAAFDHWLRCVAAELDPAEVAVSSVYLPLVHTRMSAPTGDFENVPGLSPAKAAAIVGRAIARRPARIAPWWGVVGGVAGVLAPRATERAMRRYGRNLPDDHRARSRA